MAKNSQTRCDTWRQWNCLIYLGKKKVRSLVPCRGKWHLLAVEGYELGEHIWDTLCWNIKVERSGHLAVSQLLLNAADTTVQPKSLRSGHRVGSYGVTQGWLPKHGGLNWWVGGCVLIRCGIPGTPPQKKNPNNHRARKDYWTIRKWKCEIRMSDTFLASVYDRWSAPFPGSWLVYACGFRKLYNTKVRIEVSFYFEPKLILFEALYHGRGRNFNVNSSLYDIYSKRY